MGGKTAWVANSLFQEPSGILGAPRLGLGAAGIRRQKRPLPQIDDGQDRPKQSATCWRRLTRGEGAKIHIRSIANPSGNHAETWWESFRRGRRHEQSHGPSWTN